MAALPGQTLGSLPLLDAAVGGSQMPRWVGRVGLKLEVTSQVLGLGHSLAGWTEEVEAASSSLQKGPPRAQILTSAYGYDLALLKAQCICWLVFYNKPPPNSVTWNN